MSKIITCIKFGKERSVSFISHLDVLRVFERALRRAGLPLAYTKGYSPRPKLVFGQALSLGLTSRGEYLDISLENEVDENEVQELLVATLPPGFPVYMAKNLDDKVKPVMAAITHASYLFKGDRALEILEALDKSEIIFIKEKNNKKTETDLRPLINSIEPYEDGVRLICRAGSAYNLRPDALLTALYLDDEQIKVCREDLFIERNGSLVSPLMRLM